MSEPTNDDRASWADAAMRTFCETVGIEPEDKRTQLADLLADLRHWCDQHDVDFDEVCEGSREVYREEILEENCSDWKELQT